jgi:hypothetical protein
MTREEIPLFLVGWILLVIIAIPLSYLADELMVWCDPNPVLYVFQMLGLLFMILGVVLSVWRAVRIRYLGWEDAILTSTLGILVAGFCSFMVALAWIGPMYGTVIMLVPRCY